MALKIVLNFVGFALVAFGGTMLAVFAIHFDSSTDKMAILGTILFALGATILRQFR